MRIPRGGSKGQTNVEYAIIVCLIIIAGLLIIPLFASGVRYVINTAGNSLNLQDSATTPVGASSTTPTSRNTTLAIIMVTIFATTGIPAGVSIITSFYDGAIGETTGRLVTRRRKIQRDGHGHCVECGALESYGRFSAKLCLSAISFEVWGITNISQQHINPHPTVQTEQIIVILFFLVLFNIGMHYMCSKRISDKHMPWRVFLIFLSVLIPVGLFYNMTL